METEVGLIVTAMNAREEEGIGYRLLHVTCVVLYDMYVQLSIHHSSLD